MSDTIFGSWREMDEDESSIQSEWEKLRCMKDYARTPPIANSIGFFIGLLFRLRPHLAAIDHVA